MSVFRQIFGEPGTTLKGRFNRWLRLRDKGTPLYQFNEHNGVYFTGIDRYDKRLYNAFTEVHFPDMYQWGHNEPSNLYMEPLQFVHTQIRSPFHFSYDPMFMLGWVAFSDPREAFLFYVTFSGEVEALPKDPERIEKQRQFLLPWGLAEFSKPCTFERSAKETRDARVPDPVPDSRREPSEV
jgi:hypothetical protein